MNAKIYKHAERVAQIERLRRAFTLIEILVVVTIIGLLIGILGVTVTTTIRKAREAATVALIQKIEGLLDDRRKGFERAVKSRDFEAIVERRKKLLETNGIFGVSPRVIEAIARKDFFRELFPQRFEDLTDANSNNVPDVFETNAVLKPEDSNQDGVLAPAEDLNGNGRLDGFVRYKHVNDSVNGNRNTESSELLYYALTQMQSFGVPPVGESEFGVNEVRDTDGDGLMEFVDGWGRPLRFYRWPTRLIKPNGPYGADGLPGISGGTSFLLYGTLGSDDVAVARVPPTYPSPPGLPLDMRPIASLLMEGLPPAPAFPLTQWDPLSEDPDDPYGLISTEMKRLIGSGIAPALITGSYNEALYPTLDTYHTPLIISLGADGDLGLYEPYFSEDSNGNGVLDGGEDTNSNSVLDLGILAQPIHGTGSNGAFDITTSVLTPNGNNVLSALTDNLTNRNRRAGKGK